MTLSVNRVDYCMGFILTYRAAALKATLQREDAGKYTIALLHVCGGMPMVQENIKRLGS